MDELRTRRLGRYLMASQRATKVTRLSKSALIAAVAEETGLSKKQVAAVLGALVKAIERELAPGGSSTFTLPGLARFTVQQRQASRSLDDRALVMGRPGTSRRRRASEIGKALVRRGVAARGPHGSGGGLDESKR
jgi:hypothetical protein